MRVNKGKFIRKYLRFYRIVFRIQDPYKVILDGNFIFQAIKYKVDIQERLQKLLQGASIKYFIHQSVLDELKSVGASAKPAYDYAMKYCISLRDSNTSNQVTPANTLIDFIKDKEDSNEGHYFVASQDKELRNELSKIPGIPTIYFNKVSLVLEPPSKASRGFGNRAESQKLSVQDEEAEVLKTVKAPAKMSIIGINTVISSSATSSQPVSSAKPRLKPKAKAPNPLASLPPSKDSKAYKKRLASKYKHQR